MHELIDWNPCCHSPSTKANPNPPILSQPKGGRLTLTRVRRPRCCPRAGCAREAERRTNEPYLVANFPLGTDTLTLSLGAPPFSFN